LPRLPGALLVIAAGIAIARMLHVDAHGVAVVGRIVPCARSREARGAGDEDVSACIPRARQDPRLPSLRSRF
jgi:hypothetical protein